MPLFVLWAITPATKVPWPLRSYGKLVVAHEVVAAHEAGAVEVGARAGSGGRARSGRRPRCRARRRSRLPPPALPAAIALSQAAPTLIPNGPVKFHCSAAQPPGPVLPGIVGREGGRGGDVVRHGVDARWPRRSSAAAAARTGRRRTVDPLGAGVDGAAGADSGRLARPAARAAVRGPRRDTSRAARPARAAPRRQAPLQPGTRKTAARAVRSPKYLEFSHGFPETFDGTGQHWSQNAARRRSIGEQDGARQRNRRSSRPRRAGSRADEGLRHGRDRLRRRARRGPPGRSAATRCGSPCATGAGCAALAGLRRRGRGRRRARPALHAAGPRRAATCSSTPPGWWRRARGGRCGA